MAHARHCMCWVQRGSHGDSRLNKEPHIYAYERIHFIFGFLQMKMTIIMEKKKQRQKEYRAMEDMKYSYILC